ncbi:hypothetical protein ILUMI_19141 [Ignelater luminosus]|uniref:THAP-type domain-containing protein n=1 Tax=Ignelater luminosus TaxID=2038154 RepID=A0A8K0CMX9_IGNLU|nr:hypothetical protein ILUMI_19141 [Ignelater luminosus]
MWIYKCAQQHKFHVEIARVCSEHFVDDDYSLKEKLLNLPKNKRKLKEDAVPVKRRRLLKSINEHIQANQPECEENTMLTEEVTQHSQCVATQTESSQNILLEKTQYLKDKCVELEGVIAEQNEKLRGVKKIFTEAQLRQFYSGKQNPHNGKPVYVFADTSHMIKLLRNYFIDSGFVIDGKHITSKPIVDLLHNINQSDLNIAHKINKTYLTVKDAERQKVKFAAKLLSHTIAKAVSRMGSLGLCDSNNNWLQRSELLKITNDWFDVFNGKVSQTDSRSRMKAYGLALEDQNAILDKMAAVVSGMRNINCHARLPFQNGILVSITSLKLLFRQLQNDFNIKYLLTYNLNQDVLEGFFSIRSVGGRNDEVISESSNVGRTDDVPNIVTFSMHDNLQITYNNNSIDDITVVTQQMLSKLKIPNDIECELVMEKPKCT